MKKTITFLLVLMTIGAFSYGADRTWVNKDGSGLMISGSWSSSANWSGGAVPVTGDNIVFLHDKAANISFTVSDVPNLEINDFIVLSIIEATQLPGGTVGLTLLGITDGSLITVGNDVINDNEDVKIGAKCTVICNGSNRVRWEMKPGVHFRIMASGTFTEANYDLVGDCGFQADKIGFFLKSDATMHAELIQQTTNANEIIGWQQYTFDLPVTGSRYHMIGLPIHSDVAQGGPTGNLSWVNCRKVNCLCVFSGDYLRTYTQSGVQQWNPFIGMTPIADCYDAALDIEVGRGYNIWPLKSNDYMYGHFNNNPSSISLPVQLVMNTWSLISNPYPSGVAFGYTGGGSDVGQGWGWELTDFDPIAYYYDPVTAAYKYWNWYTFSGSSLITRVMARGQGFFVHANETSTPAADITISNYAREFSTNNIIKDSRTNFMRLMLSKGDKGIDELGVYFGDVTDYKYNALYDPLKLPHQDSTISDFYATTIDNYKVMAKWLPLESVSSMIPISLDVKSGGSYTINATDLGSFSQSTIVSLKDLKTNEIINLKTNPTYSFTSEVGDDEVRFNLYFSNMLGVNDLAVNSFKVYAKAKSIFIQNNDVKNIGGTVFVYDMIGRQVMESKFNNNATIRTNLQTGFYLVSVKTEFGISNQKVYLN